MAARGAHGQDHRARPGPVQRPQGRGEARLSRRTPHAWPFTAALLAALAVGVPARVHATAPPRVFDEATLGALLGQIQALTEVLQEGLDGSTGALLLRLPALWRELAVLEEQLQRQLPLLREQLQAIERSLREFESPARPPVSGGGVIAI